MSKTEKPGEPKAGRKHRATYASDKRNGGYLVRVQGPQANAFAGRTVPVEIRGGATEHEEELVSLVWSGNDDGKISGYVGPAALYKFKSKPRDETPVEF